MNAVFEQTRVGLRNSGLDARASRKVEFVFAGWEEAEEVEEAIC